MDSPDFLPVVEDFGGGVMSEPGAAAAVNATDAAAAVNGVAVNGDVAVTIPDSAITVNVLHAEALHLTAEAHNLAQKTANDLTRDLVKRTAVAQDALFADLRAALQVVVRDEARKGACQATLLTFVGADVYKPETPAADNTEPDFCYLHLLKGPKDHVRRRELTAHGFEPLLMRLRREFAPFRVQHYWDQATNTNYVLVGW
jgi:hypothetical protein